jgi:hypothetical protein
VHDPNSKVLFNQLPKGGFYSLDSFSAAKQDMRKIEDELAGYIERYENSELGATLQKLKIPVSETAAKIDTISNIWVSVRMKNMLRLHHPADFTLFS